MPFSDNLNQKIELARILGEGLFDLQKLFNHKLTPAQQNTIDELRNCYFLEDEAVILSELDLRMAAGHALKVELQEQYRLVGVPASFGKLSLRAPAAMAPMSPPFVSALDAEMLVYHLFESLAANETDNKDKEQEHYEGVVNCLLDVMISATKQFSETTKNQLNNLHHSYPQISEAMPNFMLWLEEKTKNFKLNMRYAQLFQALKFMGINSFKVQEFVSQTPQQVASFTVLFNNYFGRIELSHLYEQLTIVNLQSADERLLKEGNPATKLYLAILGPYKGDQALLDILNAWVIQEATQNIASSSGEKKITACFIKWCINLYQCALAPFEAKNILEQLLTENPQAFGMLAGSSAAFVLPHWISTLADVGDILSGAPHLPASETRSLRAKNAYDAFFALTTAVDEDDSELEISPFLECHALLLSKLSTLLQIYAAQEEAEETTTQVNLTHEMISARFYAASAASGSKNIAEYMKAYDELQRLKYIYPLFYHTLMVSTATIAPYDLNVEEACNIRKAAKRNLSSLSIVACPVEGLTPDEDRIDLSKDSCSPHGYAQGSLAHTATEITEKPSTPEAKFVELMETFSKHAVTFFSAPLPEVSLEDQNDVLLARLSLLPIDDGDAEIKMSYEKRLQEYQNAPPDNFVWKTFLGEVEMYLSICEQKSTKANNSDSPRLSSSPQPESSDEIYRDKSMRV